MAGIRREFLFGSRCFGPPEGGGRETGIGVRGVGMLNIYIVRGSVEQGGVPHTFGCCLRLACEWVWAAVSACGPGGA